LYEAAYDRDVMTRAAAGSFVERVFDGALTPFLAFFAERATPEELAVIRQELKRIESKQGRKGAKRNVKPD
jgi:predicted transcriptional regulator